MNETEIQPARDSELHDVPVLVVQLRDDLARSRLREAFWISVVVHMVLLIGAATSPKWAPSLRPVPVRSADQLMHDRQLTYLDLPHDRQRVEKRESNIISDKNRVAASRRPSIDRKTLQELRDSSRPGPQGPAAQPAAQPSPQQQMANQGATPSPFRAQQQPRTETPQPQENPFSSAAPMSAGSAIAQAARGTRAGGGFGGSDAGGYGTGRGSPSSSVKSDMDIMSDTMGVDFGPYLTRVLHDVRMNWYNLIPEVARPPIMKRGKVSIEFVIEKDGRVAGMRINSPSGDVSLDRAAWGGISGSNPFPPLPGEFRGPYLQLRFHFFYNPAKGEMP